MSRKPILCVDFDGVIHSYKSGWKGADVIPDPPVPGAMEWLREAVKVFRVAIFSSRSHQPGGLQAMHDYIALNSQIGFRDPIEGLEWPTEKPSAFLSIDDRGLCFNGSFAEFDPAALLKFKPWYQRPIPIVAGNIEELEDWTSPAPIVFVRDADHG